jgi:hypothetical protein
MSACGSVVKRLKLPRSRSIATRTEYKSGLWLTDQHGENIRTLFDLSASGHDLPSVDDSGTTWYLTMPNAYVTYANGAVYRIANGASDPAMVATH